MVQYSLKDCGFVAFFFFDDKSDHKHLQFLKQVGRKMPLFSGPLEEDEKSF